MCSPDIPSADPNIGLAAMRTAELSEEALDWYKDYAARVLEPAQQRLTELNERVVDQQLSIGQQQQDIAADSYSRYKDTFVPVESAIAADAMKFNESDYANTQASRAAADVEQAYGQVGAEMNRDMARRGVNLSPAQIAANANDLALSKAAAKAGASNKARTDADAVGFARKMDAASIGRNLPSQQATSAQIALSSGQGASGVQQSTSAGATQAGNFVGQGYNTAIGGNQAAGNLWATSSQQNQYAAANSGSGELLGTLVGAGSRIGSAYLLSDKNLKKDRKKADASAATLAIESMPVEKWKYDEKKAPELADGREHVGPMAQDFAKHVGGDGKTIDLGSAVGVVMASQKDIAKRLKKLEKQA